MGVFPICNQIVGCQRSLPHARGGVSIQREALSPSNWVFPTLVGVFPSQRWTTRYHPQSSPRSWGCFRIGRLRAAKRTGLPHARGGVSCTCFYIRLLRVVFPTLVGVFPSGEHGTRFPGRLPHARGGVSKSQIILTRHHTSSPRSWGCFCIRVNFLQ